MQSWHIVLIIGSAAYATIIAANCLLTWHLVMSGRPAPSTKGRFFYCILFGLQSSLMLMLMRYADQSWLRTAAISACCATLIMFIDSFMLPISIRYGYTAWRVSLVLWFLLVASFVIGSFPPQEAES